jgi:hypothetical protein
VQRFANKRTPAVWAGAGTKNTESTAQAFVRNAGRDRDVEVMVQQTPEVLWFGLERPGRAAFDADCGQEVFMCFLLVRRVDEIQAEKQLHGFFSRLSPIPCTTCEKLQVKPLTGTVSKTCSKSNVDRLLIGIQALPGETVSSNGLA